VGHIARMGEVRNTFKVLVGKLRRPKCRGEDNIGMDVREIWWEDVALDSTGSGQVIVNTVMNLRVT